MSKGGILESYLPSPNESQLQTNFKVRIECKIQEICTFIPRQMQINEAIEDDTSKSLAGLTSRRFLLYSHASRFPSQTVTRLELSAIAKPAKGEVFFLH